MVAVEATFHLFKVYSGADLEGPARAPYEPLYIIQIKKLAPPVHSDNLHVY